MNIFQKAIQFFQEAYAELKKVTWISRKQVIASTIVVIVLVLLVAAYVFVIDFFLSKLIAYLI